jgi:uncharacterized protein
MSGVPNPTHLLVDAHNVIHAWAELSRLWRLPGGKSSARDALARRVRVLHDEDGLRVTLVFDGRGERIEEERPGRDASFVYLFSPAGLTADGVIERMAGQAADPSHLLVATGDGMIRSTVEALGAVWISPENLRERVDRAEREQAARARRTQRKADGGFGNRLPL